MSQEITDPGTPPRSRHQHQLRRGRLLAVALSLAVVACLAVLARHDVAAAVRQLDDLRWTWAAVAAATGVLSLVLYAGVRLVLLRAAGATMTAPGMIGLTFASGAIAASVPAGGAVATVYTFRQYRAAGANDGAATWALFVNGAITPGVLAALALVGVALAAPTGVVAVLGPIAAAVGFVVLTTLVVRRPSILVGPITLGLRVVRTVRRRPTGDAAVTAAAIVERFADVRMPKRVLLAAVSFQLASWIVDVGCLAASIVAVGGVVPWRALLAVFAASQLVGRIPILPGGFGQIETGLVVGLHAAGMPIAIALAATLVFRVASQWLILPLGWPAWWWRRRRTDTSAAGAPVPRRVDALARPG
jgi:putative heme transporter